MKYLFFAIFIISCSTTHKMDHDKSHKHGNHEEHHRFSDVKKWEKIFEDKERDGWQQPYKVLSSLKIKKNSIIADIGSATGYFPVRIAKKVPRGRVWGIDVEPNLVRFLNERARSENINNLFSILGEFSDPLIPEPVDFIFMVNTYHHISDRVKYFSNIRTKLKTNGKLIIIDFRKEELPIGPPVEAKLSKTQILAELEEAGYSYLKDFQFLRYQNILVFE